ncbi:MAG TPA: tetratricopeptide repeat protein, partial [Polyangia bacterium]|nr:tetratricopeptide repeat protein [Polyangia bacterium]
MTAPPPTDDAAAKAAAPGTEDNRLMSHLASAGELMAGRHFRQAEVELLRALSTTPADVRALNLLALVRFKLGKLEEARTTYREIADLLPGDAGIQRNFGLVSLKMERYEDAVAALERATRLAPDDKRAWSYLGYALVKNGDSTGAALAFRRGGQDLLAAQLEPVVAADATTVETSKVAVATGDAAPAAEVAPEPFAQEGSVVEPRNTSVTVTPGSVPAAYVPNGEVVNSLVPLAAATALNDSQTVSLVSFVLAGMG